MKLSVIIRILNKRTACIYGLAILLLLSLTGSFGVNDVIGGLDISHGGAFNILKIMRWNIAVLPPITVSVMYIMEEFGALSVYTIIRCKNIVNWCAERYFTILIANIAYFCALLIITTLASRNVSGLSYRLILFPLHTLLVSIILATAIGFFRKPSVSAVLFAVIEVLCVVIGSVKTGCAKYFIAFWGMSKSRGLFSPVAATDRLITITISLLLMSFCFAAIILRCKSQSPVESNALEV